MDFAERFAGFVQKLGLAWQRVSLAEFFVVVFFLQRIGIIYYLVYSDPKKTTLFRTFCRKRNINNYALVTGHEVKVA